MRIAIDEAKKGIKKGGGPFGAVIVKNNKLIAKAHNAVTLSNDPTAHAEICAIRKACKKLKTFDLHGCVIYSTCEPCPMCFSAIHWARISTVFYGTTKKDAMLIGFDDKLLYDILEKKRKPAFLMKQIDYIENKVLFGDWSKLKSKKLY